MRIVRVVPGTPVPEELGRQDVAVLAHTTTVGDERWDKGRRLSLREAARLAREVRDPRPLTLLVLASGDLHADEAALRLAAAVAGGGVAGCGVTGT